MEGLTRLVNDSLARHGIETPLDHRRLHWSRWFRCESCLSFVLVPSQPGVFALAEEIIAPGECGAAGNKRMLALYQVSEADDLAMALGRLFLPGTPDRERLVSGRCFARYSVIADAGQRRSAHNVFKQWLSASAETASGISSSAGSAYVDADDLAVPFAGNQSHAVASGEAQTEVVPPAGLPLGF
jgi:hypothetical protein